MTDEVMYQLAALLPPAYRGLYSDLSKATQDYITFTLLAKTGIGTDHIFFRCKKLRFLHLKNWILLFYLSQ